MDNTRTDIVAEKESQPEPMSSSKQTTTDNKDVSAAPQEVPDTAQAEELVLPEGVKDRTAEQFERLKEQLRDERLRREEAESYLNQTRYQSPAAQQRPIYDPDTGYVDVNELEALRVRAAKAEEAAAKADTKLEKFIAQQQEAEAYVSYPELNTKSKEYDKNFANMARALITDSIMNPKDHGGELTLKQAADRLKGVSARELAKAEQAGKEKAVEELTPKEQASLEASGRSDMRNETEYDYNDLRTMTRRGSKDAVIARLRNLTASQ